MWYVYILREHHGRMYIGSTNNLDRRLAEHSKKKIGNQLLSYIVVANEDKARSLEMYFKSGSGRALLKKRILSDEALA